MSERVKLKKTRSKSLNKALTDIEETLNAIDDKLNDLRELDKGSKFFALIGYLLIGLGGGGLLTIGIIFQNAFLITDLIILFIMSSLLVLLMIGGFMLAHKGLTGDWL